MSTEYRTSPDHENEGWPPGVPYIVGNEACERFSFYGMKAILYVHLVSLYMMASYVAEEAGKLGVTAADHSATLATRDVHMFIAGVYAFPMIGALLADRLLGKYRTILYLSLVYCAGHVVLSFFDTTLMGMYVGLALIAVGSGGIKPCVSANVGDQFGKKNWNKVQTIFQIFYFSINFGSAFATIMIPRMREVWGASIAFLVPGILMFIATFLFWLGRKKFVHVPPSPGGMPGLLDVLSGTFLFMTFGQLFFTSSWSLPAQVGTGLVCLAIGLALWAARQRILPDNGFLSIMLWTLYDHLRGNKAPRVVSSGGSAVGVPSRDGEEPKDEPLRKYAFWRPAVDRFGQQATEGPVAVWKIISIFLFVSVFWALFDQHTSSWIRQAEMMDRGVNLFGWEFELLASEIPALNPWMVMILIPIIDRLYKLSSKLGFEATPLRRMSVGMLMAGLAFVAVALIQAAIDAQGVGQVPVAWQIIAYFIMTASEVMVSITGLEFAYTQAPKSMKSVILGFWLLTVTLGNILVVFIAQIPELALVNFFWLFAVLMFIAGGLFALRAAFYKQKDYPQE